MCATESLKLERDFSKYNYLSLDSAVVSKLDDAANFRTVRVGISHTSGGVMGWVDFGVNHNWSQNKYQLHGPVVLHHDALS